LLLSRDFVSLILFAMLISIPATYYLVEQWLKQYAFRIDLNIGLFVIPSLMVLIISVITISGKTFRISAQNPVTSLRDE
jgi:putative ABC transport system permease protein